MSKTERKQRRTWSNRTPLAIGIGTVLFLVLAVGGWSRSVEITGAVLGQGSIQVAANKQAIQHPIGGVVSEILVANGDHVHAGDVVVRLDDAKLRSELDVVEGELFELLATESRLEAEVDEATELSLHPLLEEAVSIYPDVGRLVERQRKHLASRADLLEKSAHLLKERISQVEKQIAGIKAEHASKSLEKALLEEEIDGARDLVKRQLMRKSVVFTLSKDRLKLDGDLGKLAAELAEMEGKIAEFNLELSVLAPKKREEAMVELEKLRPLKNAAFGKRLALLDGLSKLDIRSPISGKAHDSQIAGLQSVVVAASPLMYVIPDDKPHVVIVKVDATDIDQLFNGQTASLRFTSFNRRKTPIIEGHLTRISPAAFLDKERKRLYYEVEIAILKDEVSKLGDKPLIPGMPVDAFIATQSRSPLSYVTRPIVDYFDLAFRDS